MPVDVRGRIVYNPSAKDGDYRIECPQLGISIEGSGTIEDDIETLRQEIEEKIQEEFKCDPSIVQMTGYSMGLAFSIEGPTNCTLDQFTRKEDETASADGEE